MKKFEKELMTEKFTRSTVGGTIIILAIIVLFMLLVSGIMTLIFG